EQEHAKVKELVAQLKTIDATTDDVESLLAELKADVQHHVQEEETEAFPKFRESVDQSELQSLATRVQEAKQQADAQSTRPLGAAAERRRERRVGAFAQ